MPEQEYDLDIVIKWLTGWIWKEAPRGKSTCRGCGRTILALHPAYKYIFGFYRSTPKIGCLCPECGEAAVRALFEHICELMGPRQVIATVSGGELRHIEGLPPGWDYELVDFDRCPECGGTDPDCELCKQMK